MTEYEIKRIVDARIEARGLGPGSSAFTFAGLIIACWGMIATLVWLDARSERIENKLNLQPCPWSLSTRPVCPK